MRQIGLQILSFEDRTHQIPPSPECLSLKLVSDKPDLLPEVMERGRSDLDGLPAGIPGILWDPSWKIIVHTENEQMWSGFHFCIWSSQHGQDQD